MADLIQGQGPEVFHDGGAAGRVMVADSLSYFEHEAWPDDVVLGASFAGAPTAAMPMRRGVKGWIAHEGGPGKDMAGIGGLPLADRFGVPAAAVATREAGLSDGRSLVGARVTHANRTAQALGVRVGMTGGEAGKLMLAAPRGKPLDLDALIDESTHEVASTGQGRILAVWSFSRVAGEHPRDVFCVASHGGKVMAQYALRVRPKGLIANDADGGLNGSGSDGLAAIDELCGIPCATVSSDSARIGDALSTWHDGIISAANRSAAALGIHAGMRASDAARRMLEAEGTTMAPHTPHFAGEPALAPLASRYVDVAALPWKPTPTPGIDMKVLLRDERSGLLTALFRWEPGTELGLHEHVEIEQTYVLEGSIVDEEGEVRAGDYVWRPRGNRHVARSPGGALVLSFFLKPNKFLAGGLAGRELS